MNAFKCILVTAISLTINTQALSQCFGPYCQDPNQPSYYSQPGYGSQPPNFSERPIQPFEVDDNVLKRIENASVIVYSKEIGMRSMGSGTLVRWGDSVIVLTASHVVSNPNATYIIKPDFGEVVCTLHKINRIVDYAILEPTNHQEQLYEIAVDVYSGSFLRGGEELIAAGYGGKNKVFLWCTHLLNYAPVTRGHTRDWMELRVAARNGDSGGGIFTKKGELVGIIWGAWRYSSTQIQYIDTLMKDGMVISSVNYVERLQGVRAYSRSGTFAVWIGGLTNDLIELKCIWRRPRRPILPGPNIQSPRPPVDSAPGIAPKPSVPAESVPAEKPKVQPPDYPDYPDYQTEEPKKIDWLGFLWPTILVMIGWVSCLVSMVIVIVTGHYLKE